MLAFHVSPVRVCPSMYQITVNKTSLHAFSRYRVNALWSPGAAGSRQSHESAGSRDVSRPDAQPKEQGPTFKVLRTGREGRSAQGRHRRDRTRVTGRGSHRTLHPAGRDTTGTFPLSSVPRCTQTQPQLHRVGCSKTTSPRLYTCTPSPPWAHKSRDRNRATSHTPMHRFTSGAVDVLRAWPHLTSL